MAPSSSSLTAREVEARPFWAGAKAAAEPARAARTQAVFILDIVLVRVFSGEM